MNNQTTPPTNLLVEYKFWFSIGIPAAIITLILALVSFSNGLWFLALLVLGGGGWLSIFTIKEGMDFLSEHQDTLKREQEYKALNLSLPTTAPVSLPSTDSDQANGAIVSDGANYLGFGFTVLGNQPSSYNQTYSISTRDRYAGMYVIGVQGVGKSSFLETLIFQEINNGQAVIVLDPDGDLIDHCLAQLPKEQLANTYVFDIEDVSYPFGLNLFHVPATATVTEQSQAQDRILHIFEKCFPETSRMLLEKYLGNIAPVFFANAQKGYAMTDIPKFLRDDAFRARLLRNNQVRYFIREFWEDEYGQLSPSKRQTETASLATRLNRFVRSPIVGNIIGQSSTTIDFRRAIENKEVIFIKLPVKTLREDAQLIGTMLIAQIHAAIFSFADTPLEQRPGFSLFVDEVQHFATSDFSEMFTEGRKFGSRVTVAHQFRDQLPEYLKSSTMTARTKVCFQTTQEDSREMSYLYRDIIQAKPDRDSLDPDPIGYLLEHGSDNPNIRFFIEKYLRPLKKDADQPVTSHVSVNVATNQVTQTVDGQADKEKAKATIRNLNRFLFEAQLQENWQMPFSQEDIQTCFSLLLTKFYSNNHSRVTRVIFQFGSYQDYGAPETSINQEGMNRARDRMLKNFIAMKGKHDAYRELETLDSFLEVLADVRILLHALVQNPIGNVRKISTAEIASLIVNLPHRNAFVRSGSDVFQITTLDVPVSISSTALEVRKRTIQQQTRAKYCRPANQVESEIGKRLGLQSTSEPESET